MNTPGKNAPLHFLVVDDDAESRKTIIEYLKSMGHEKVTQAADGSEGLRLLERVPTINFIISDWDMPNMNGLAFLQALRSNQAYSQIPFLIATSPVSQETEKIVLAAESMVNAYVIKPFRSQVLKEKIDHVLDLSVRGPQKPVVLVEDDPDSLSMVTEYLGRLGFKEVRPFSEGTSAIQFLIENADQVGLIIADWEMPGMNGVELLRACKAHPTLNHVPFLMITSQTSMEKMKIMQAARANVDQYLLKPFTVNDLKKRVDTMLERSVNLKQIEGMLTEAADHFGHGRHQKAYDIFESALQLDETHEGALLGIGDVTVKMKGMQAALVFYKKAVEVAMASPTACAKLVNCYEQLGMLDKAIAVAQSGVQNVGFSADLHFLLGRLYSRKGMNQEAKEEFQKTLDIQIDHKEAKLLLEMVTALDKKQ